MKIVAILFYNIFLLAGTAFLVTEYDWSPLWMFGAAGMCIMRFNSNSDK